jgi:hypothetical protein
MRHASVVAVLSAALLAGGCGGQGGFGSQTATTATVARTVCKTAWHCGARIAASDLALMRAAFPTVNAIYRNGESYYIYTSLPTTSYTAAVDVCNAFFAKVIGGPAASADGTVDITVLSEGGPTTSVKLVSVAAVSVGCM